MKKEFPTLNVLATAIAAYEFNQRQILRNPVTVDNLARFPNRQLITDYVQGNGGPFIVNDFHIKQAEGVNQYLQQTVIMQSLKGAPDRFLAQLAALIAEQDIAVKDFGIVAWAPHLADQYQRKDHIREVGARYERSSRYIGRIGDKITTDFTLIEKRYVKSMDCFVVYGYDADDNLITYWARTLDKVCEVGKISGRIKAHKEDEYHNNARVTVMNYIKVI